MRDKDKNTALPILPRAALISHYEGRSDLSQIFI